MMKRSSTHGQSRQASGAAQGERPKATASRPSHTQASFIPSHPTGTSTAEVVANSSVPPKTKYESSQLRRSNTAT